MNISREDIGRLRDMGAELVAAFSRAQLKTHASSGAFYLFTSMIPLFTMLVTAISYSGLTLEDLMAVVSQIVPDALLGFVGTVVRDAYANASVALSVSLISLFWAASKGVKALAIGLNATFDVRESRNAVKLTLVSFVGVVVIVALLSATLYLIFSDGVLHLLATIIPSVVEPDLITVVARVVLVIVSTVLAITLFYTFLPAGTRRMRDQVPGAVLCTVLWFLLSFGFHIYVDNSRHLTLLYGSLATIMLFLLWLYWLFYLMLACAFVNRLRLVRRDWKRGTGAHVSSTPRGGIRVSPERLRKSPAPVPPTTGGTE